jgi:hypothetical protein
VAIDASNPRQILRAKGDPAGAQRNTERALQIDEKVYGPDHPTTRSVRKILEQIGNQP